MKTAGLDIQTVNKCVADKTLLSQSMVQLNTSKTAMYKRLLPNSGVFPHIFVDGVQLYNYTWAGLLRRLCEKMDANALPAPCQNQNLAVELKIVGDITGAQPTMLSNAIEAAINLVVSNASFPVNFFTDDDALDGAPSYLDVNATLKLNVQKPANGVIRFSVTVLKHFADGFAGAVPTKAFLEYTDWALGAIAGVKNVRVVGAQVVPTTLHR